LGDGTVKAMIEFHHEVVGGQVIIRWQYYLLRAPVDIPIALAPTTILCVATNQPKEEEEEEELTSVFVIGYHITSNCSKHR